MTLLTTLVIALAITQALDFYTTRTILKAGGHEQNPIVKKLMDIFGRDVFLVSKGIAVVAAGSYVGSESILLLGVLVLFYVGIIVHNWKSMP